MLISLLVYPLRWLLRLLPKSMIAPLDAWSRRVARRRLERRRNEQARSTP
jgi:hypothetical protein